MWRRKSYIRPNTSGRSHDLEAAILTLVAAPASQISLLLRLSKTRRRHSPSTSVAYLQAWAMAYVVRAWLWCCLRCGHWNLWRRLPRCLNPSLFPGNSCVYLPLLLCLLTTWHRYRFLLGILAVRSCGQDLKLRSKLLSRYIPSVCAALCSAKTGVLTQPPKEMRNHVFKMSVLVATRAEDSTLK